MEVVDKQSRQEGCTLRVSVQVYKRIGSNHRYHEVPGSALRIDLKKAEDLPTAVQAIKDAITAIGQ